MRKKLSFIPTLIIIGVVILCNACCNSRIISTDKNAQWMQTDSVVAEHLKDLSNLLMTPDSVLCYRLYHKDSISKNDIQPIEGYIRDTIVIKLNKEQIGILQFLLINNKSCYKNDTLLLQSPYIPELEYAFNQGDSLRASIIISQTDQTWSLISSGKTLFNYNYSDKIANNRFFDQFAKQLYK